jgi:hypothetical protein
MLLRTQKKLEETISIANLLKYGLADAACALLPCGVHAAPNGKSQRFGAAAVCKIRSFPLGRMSRQRVWQFGTAAL